MLQFDLIADNEKIRKYKVTSGKYNGEVTYFKEKDKLDEKSYIFEGTFSKFIGKLKTAVIIGNSVEALPNNPLKHFVYGVG